MRRALLLLLATVTLAGGLLSCEKKPKRVVIVLEGHTSLAISFDVPVTGELTTFSEVCEDAVTYLVSVDTDADAEWEWRFAFDFAGNLYGCPEGLCADPTIRAHLGDPRRIMVEGLDIAPDQYGSVAHDVVCRGIADTESGMGAISTAPVGTAGQLAIEAEVPLLRPGHLNGLFAAASIGFGTSGSGRDPDAAFDVRSPGGGTVILAGGTFPATGMVNTVWAFEPWQIGMREIAALAGPRQGLAMVPFHHASGPALLLASGERPFTPTENSGNRIGEILFADGTLTVVADTMNVARVTRNVHLVEMEGEDVVVFLAGCEYGMAGTYNVDGYEYFSASGAVCDAGGPTFCRPNLASGSGTFGCGRVSARFDNPFGEPHVAIGGGYFDADTAMFAFDALPAEFSAASPLPRGITRTTTLEVSSNLTYVIGGGSVVPGAPDDCVMRTRTGAFQAGVWNADVGPGLATPRWSHALTPLADGRLLVVGGERDRDPAEPNYIVRPLASLEIIEPGPSGTIVDGVSRLLAQPGEQCVTGSSAGCVLMPIRRVSPLAVMITGSDTWLNGAVVLGGGGTDVDYNVPTGGPPELFVPAYQCATGTTRPRSYVNAGPAPGLDVCDLARDPALLPLTDPTAPAGE